MFPRKTRTMASTSKLPRQSLNTRKSSNAPGKSNKLVTPSPKRLGLRRSTSLPDKYDLAKVSSSKKLFWFRPVQRQQSVGGLQPRSLKRWKEANQDLQRKWRDGSESFSTLSTGSRPPFTLRLPTENDENMAQFVTSSASNEEEIIGIEFLDDDDAVCQ